MTRSRRIFAWTGATLLVVLAVLVIVIVTFDWNRIKPTLNEKVSEALHRPFAINGNLTCAGRVNLNWVAGAPGCPRRILWLTT